MSVNVLENHSRRFGSSFTNNQAHKSADFRSDISGMRALAVLLVLLSHYEIANFSAGFVGVDIFFVISGYLITGLLAASTSEIPIVKTGWAGSRLQRSTFDARVGFFPQPCSFLLSR